MTWTRCFRGQTDKASEMRAIDTEFKPHTIPFTFCQYANISSSALLAFFQLQDFSSYERYSIGNSFLKSKNA